MKKIDNKKVKNYDWVINIVFIVILVGVPFAYPLISNLLIHINWLNSIGEIKEYLEIFGIYNVIIIIIVLLGIKHYFEISFGDLLEKITTNIDINFKNGENELQVHVPIKRNTVNAENMAKEIKEEAYEEIIKENKVENDRCADCNLDSVIEERESLRFFSAYQITNQFTRELLKKIVMDSRIELQTFITLVIGYYKKTIRNMGKVRKNQYIERKVNELLYNLRYLDIIEYTEDDAYIIMTQRGIEFVKGYEEGVG